MSSCTPLEEAVLANDALPQAERRTNDDIAQEYGTSEASVRRARKRVNCPETPRNAGNSGNSGNAENPLIVEGSENELEFDNLTTDAPLANTADSTAFQAIFDLANLNPAHYRLKDGSLRFSTWQQGRKNQSPVQLYSYRGSFEKIDPRKEELEADIVAQIKATPAQPAATTPDPRPTYILSISDLQGGKALEHGGGTKETVARVQQATAAFISRLPSGAPGPLVPEIVLIDGGDIIENMFNTPSQPYTNDLDLAAQIRVMRRLVIDIVLALAPYTQELTYICVPSNHGQVRAQRGKGQAGTTEADFGLDIQEQVKDAIALNPELSTKVHFVRPPLLEETAVYTTQDGTKLAVNHGHRTGGQNKVCDWWARQDHGRMPGWDADILVAAHYHTPYVRQSGDGRWVLGMASAEPGSHYFALSSGEQSQKGCTAFMTFQGQWSDYRIL